MNPPPSVFSNSEGKPPKEALGGRLSGGGINVTFLHLNEHQLSAMHCVALNQIDDTQQNPFSALLCREPFL